MKNQSVFVCTKCDAQFKKWLGQCGECGGWGTVVNSEEAGVSAVSGVGMGARAVASAAGKGRALVPTPLSSVESHREKRLSTGIGELDRVYGGGVVAGSVTLLGGEPGIGKSTLALMACARIAGRGASVLYFSGEESGSQVKLRAERLGSGDAMAFLAVTDVLDIVATLRKEKPVFAVVDSVQTLEISDNPAEAGTVSQVRGAAGFLVQAAKELNVPLLLIGHVTKDGTVAGPKTLEHMVDAVFVFEGERSHPLRVLRSLKNRFGATDESGMFSMDGTGLVEVSNPSAFLLEERQLGVPGSVISCMTGGSRPMLIEIQALVQKSAFGYPVRRASGFDHERLEMIVAIIGRHGKVNLGESDVFVNIVGGLKAREPALDLAVALAVCSAATGVALPQGLAAFGELGLGGEVRSVIGLEKRLFEASSFGLAEVVTAVPKGWKGGGGVARGKSPVMVRGVRSLIDALVVCREKVTSAS